MSRSPGRKVPPFAWPCLTLFFNCRSRPRVLIAITDSQTIPEGRRQEAGAEREVPTYQETKPLQISSQPARLGRFVNVT